MKRRTTTFSLLLTCLSAAATAATDPADGERLRAAILLERATWGPRPGDVEAVIATGTDAWLERQLHPEHVDDRALEARLAGFHDIQAETGALLEKYPRPDREERRALKEMREERQEAKEGGSTREPRDAGERARMREMRDELGGPRRVILELMEARLLRAAESERQLEEVLADFWFNHFNVYARKDIPTSLAMPSYEREAIRPHVLGRFEDLLVATARHPAMLRYLDNWTSTREGFDPREAMESRRDYGRGGMRGFGEGPRGRSRFRREPPQEGRRKFGLNENYARELLELHTLGVDGGYGQDDVVAVARCFTGWTVIDPESIARSRRARGGGGGSRAMDGEFHFLEEAHDGGHKVVLGRTIDAGGEEDGMEVLRMLAAHPTTARHVCRKLAQRFVAESPSPEIVGEMTDAWQRSGGDLRETLRAMFTSPRFVLEASARDKVKTPLELVVSSLRATGATILAGEAISREIADLGMPLYNCQPPTGYDEASATWLSAGGMLGRVRFLGALVSGKLPGVRTPPATTDVEAWAAQVMPRGAPVLSAAEVATLREGLTGIEGLAPASPGEAMALRLASPQFQRQ